MPFRPVRFDALVCSNTCAKRKSRGGDLAYLATLPPDQARLRRIGHETTLDSIAVARMASALQREGRLARRNLPKVKRMTTAPRT
jgi:hypothetical protein